MRALEISRPVSGGKQHSTKTNTSESCSALKSTTAGPANDLNGFGDVVANSLESCVRQRPAERRRMLIAVLEGPGFEDGLSEDVALSLRDQMGRSAKRMRCARLTCCIDQEVPPL